MTNYFTIPGIGNSGDKHWQTFFEQSGINFKRIEQKEWDAPVCDDWVTNIDSAIKDYDPASVVLIGHSLGCAAIVYWVNRFKKIIKGAMLVSPSDMEAPQYKFPTTGFDVMPTSPINFKTIVVASANDEWVALDRAKYFAGAWGSEFINIGMAGHINVASGYGPWVDGLTILKKLG